MTIRCGCRDEADEIVFGPDHQCSREGRAAVNLQAELDRLEREDPAVARAVAGMERTADYIMGRLPADQIAAIYNPPEPRYMETLDEAERRGD